MSPTLGVVIMINNYLHDVATALLAAAGVAMWLMVRHYERSGGEAAGPYFVALYRSMTRLALGSLVWIVLGGIPRTIFYEQLEWADYAGKGQVSALVVKHVVMFCLVGLGVAMWLKLRGKVAVLASPSDAR